MLMLLDMNWNDFFWFAIVFNAGFLYCTWLNYRQGKKEMPYRWACLEDECEFTIKANDIKAVDAWATAHKEASHES